MASFTVTAFFSGDIVHLIEYMAPKQLYAALSRGCFIQWRNIIIFSPFDFDFCVDNATLDLLGLVAEELLRC